MKDEPDDEKVSRVVGKLAMNKHPAVFAEKLADKGGRKRVVGLDFGTNMGVTYADVDADNPLADVFMVMQQWDLSVGPYDTGPLRFIRLEQFLTVLRPDLILCEDVKFTPSTTLPNGQKISIMAVVARVSTAAELLGGLKFQTSKWAERHGVPLQGVGIGTIKKYATGSGSADKTAMIRECNKRFGTQLDPDTYKETGADNMADSAFLCAMGIEHYYDGLNYGKDVSAAADPELHRSPGDPGGAGRSGAEAGPKPARRKAAGTGSRRRREPEADGNDPPGVSAEDTGSPEADLGHGGHAQNPVGGEDEEV